MHYKMSTDPFYNIKESKNDCILFKNTYCLFLIKSGMTDNHLYLNKFLLWSVVDIEVLLSIDIMISIISYIIYPKLSFTIC